MNFAPLGRALAVAAGVLAAAPAAARELQGEDTGQPSDLTESIPSGEDRVESIAPDSATTPAETPETPETPDVPAAQVDEPARVQLSGYARQSFELDYGELSRRVSTAPQASTWRRSETPFLWRDVFASRTQLVLRASYLQNRRFEATVSGVLGYTLHVAKEAPVFSAGVVDLTRGELDPQLRDAYVAFFWPSVDLRIGQQRVAWGKADFQSPNDVINARDLRDPFLSENELRYLPTPVVRASISGGPVTFEAVVSPFFVPDRFDVYGSNWAAIQADVRDSYAQFLGSSSLLVDPSIEREYAALWRQTERPPDNGRGLAAGARLSASLSGTDLSAYYHYGYDSTPYVQISREFIDWVDNTAFITTNGEQPSALLGAAKFKPLLDLMDQLSMEGRQLISARYIRRHHVGADLATTFGPIVLRLDAAYETKRTFYEADDLNSFATPAVLGVLGLEYQTGSLDDVLLVELLGARLLHKPPEPLLAYDQTTTAVAGTLRWTLGDSWGIDLRGLVGIHPQTYLIQPAIRFKPNDAFTLRLGTLVVSGETASFGWYYRDNDTAFVQLRYAF